MPPPCFAGRPVGRATLRSWKTTVGGWPPGGRGELLLVEAVPGQRVPDALSIWGSDALVDRERAPQGPCGLGGAIRQEAQADTSQGVGFLTMSPDVPGDGEGLAVVIPGLLGP